MSARRISLNVSGRLPEIPSSRGIEKSYSEFLVLNGGWIVVAATLWLGKNNRLWFIRKNVWLRVGVCDTQHCNIRQIPIGVRWLFFGGSSMKIFDWSRLTVFDFLLEHVPLLGYSVRWWRLFAGQMYCGNWLAYAGLFLSFYSVVDLKLYIYFRCISRPWWGWSRW